MKKIRTAETGQTILIFEYEKDSNLEYCYLADSDQAEPAKERVGT